MALPLTVNQGTQSLFPDTITFQWTLGWTLDCSFVARGNADQERRRPPNFWWLSRHRKNSHVSNDAAHKSQQRDRNRRINPDQNCIDEKKFFRAARSNVKARR